MEFFNSREARRNVSSEFVASFISLESISLFDRNPDKTPSTVFNILEKNPSGFALKEELTFSS